MTTFLTIFSNYRCLSWSSLIIFETLIISTSRLLLSYLESLTPAVTSSCLAEPSCVFKWFILISVIKPPKASLSVMPHFSPINGDLNLSSPSRYPFWQNYKHPLCKHIIVPCIHSQTQPPTPSLSWSLVLSLNELCSLLFCNHSILMYGKDQKKLEGRQFTNILQSPR